MLATRGGRAAMSYLAAAPEFLTSAATDLSNIGSAVIDANAVAAAPTTSVLAAGADEVSAVVAALFAEHGQAFQALSAQAATFHAQFVQALTGAGAAYTAAEVANVSPLQELQSLPRLGGQLAGAANAVPALGLPGLTLPGTGGLPGLGTPSVGLPGLPGLGTGLPGLSLLPGLSVLPGLSLLSGLG